MHVFTQTMVEEIEMKKATLVYKDEVFQLHSTPKGYWLYCFKAKMNLAMEAETEHEAMSEALNYYQRRTLNLEEENAFLKKQVFDFIEKIMGKQEVLDYLDFKAHEGS